MVTLTTGVGLNYEWKVVGDVPRKRLNGGKWFFELEIVEQNFIVPVGGVQLVERVIGFYDSTTDDFSSNMFLIGPDGGYVDGDVVGVSVDMDQDPSPMIVYHNGVFEQAGDVTADLNDDLLPGFIMRAEEV